MSGCGKIAYASRKLAAQAANCVESRVGGQRTRHPYWCAECHAFHITRAIDQRGKAETFKRRRRALREENADAPG